MLAVKLTTQEWTVLVAFGGVVIGGVLATAGGVWQTHAQNKHARQLAFTASQRDAYLEVLTWFALVRDALRESVLTEKPWSGTDIAAPRESARVDALTEMYGSAPFRQATAQWQPAFLELVRVHDIWVFLNDQTPAAERGRDQPLAEATSELQARMASLAEVLLAIQEVARSEASSLAARP